MNYSSWYLKLAILLIQHVKGLAVTAEIFMQLNTTWRAQGLEEVKPYMHQLHMSTEISLYEVYLNKEHISG